MAVHDFRSQRLFLNADLFQGADITADRNQANYLLNVLRMGEGDRLFVFNGRQGEWQALIHPTGRKSCRLIMEMQTRSQPVPADLTYCFAPLKQARLDYMVQKATEMGVGRMVPVITHYTQVRKLNGERLRANIIEAAEQCGILNIPDLDAPVGLEKLPERLGDRISLFFCDEAQSDACSRIENKPANGLAVLVGPEGGFSNEERALIHSWSNVTILGLGPRILRADTAAVAALTLVQSKFGDWYR